MASDDSGSILATDGLPWTIVDAQRVAALNTAKNRVLEIAVSSLPLREMLAGIARQVEDSSRSGVLASILLVDPAGRCLRHGAGPSLPPAYNEAIDGIPIGEGVGSCGTAAATRSPVYVSDIATDPRWSDFRDLAGTHGLAACWSIPILSANGTVLGTFAMYHRVPRAPGVDDLELVDIVVRTVALVIERRNAEDSLRESEARLRFLSTLEEALARSRDPIDAMEAAAGLLGRHVEASRCAYADVDADSDRFVIRANYTVPGLDTSAGVYSLDLFGPRAAADMRRGHTLVVRDVTAEVAAGEGREMFLSIGIEAIICCPLVRDDRLVAMMALHQRHPRDWRPDEVTLVEAVVERCWAHIERVGAEARRRESEARFHAIANSVDQMIWSTRPDGCHDYFNDRWYEYTGVSHGSTDGEGWNIMFHPDDQERAWQTWRHSLATGEPYHIEYRLRHRSGAYRWVIGRAQCERDARGEIVRWYGTCTDINYLKESEQTLHWAQQAGGVGVFHVGMDGVIQATPEFCRLYGVGEGASLPAHVFEDLVVPEDRHLVSDLRSRASGDAPLDVEYRIRRADTGEVRWIARKGEILRDGDGKPLRFAGVARDVTEAREAIDALASSEGRYRALFEAIDDGFCIIELIDGPHGALSDYVHVDANPGYARQTGITDVVGRRIRELEGERDADGWVALYGDVLRTGDPVRFERFFEAAGRHIEVSAARVEPASRRQVSILFRDIEERRRSEIALRESEAATRDAIDRVQLALSAGAIIGTWFWDLVTDRFTVDEGFAKAFGLDPALGREGLGLQQIVATVHPDDRRALAASIDKSVRNGGAYAHQYRVRRADGRYYWIEANGRVDLAADGTPISFPGVVIDVEERRAVEKERDRATAALRALNDTLEQRIADRTADLMKTEEALRQAQKMEAVGQLTGGIAHDFNNMLTGVIGSLDLIQRHIANGRMDRVDRYIDAATTSAQRAAALTSRLLAFGRRQSLDLKPVDINVLVAGMEDLLHRTLGEQVALESHLGAGTWTACTDANQLESALLNLCINARDAMPGGGKLTIETANGHLDERYTRDHPDVTPGDYIVLSVTDTGTGMSPATIEKVFEPFFTTKPVGQGTGLGLSMIYGFARQSGGHVRIYSEIGQGTTVKLYAPRFEGDADADERAAVEVPLGAGETVLVVEDDPSVRMIVLDVLGELGYGAIEAVDASAAIPILQSHQRIDLLVTDVGLPGMNGRQLAEIARQTRPDLRVLFITGYAENAAVRGGFLDAGMDMLTKPFAIDALATRMREMLES